MYKEEIANAIIVEMMPHLNSEQIAVLKNSLYTKMNGFKIEKETNELMVNDDSNYYAVQAFLQSKMASNAIGKNTVKQYTSVLRSFFTEVTKSYKDITSNDIRTFLAKSRVNKITGEMKKTSSMSNVYNVISSFFRWLYDNGYIESNPVSKVEQYKVAKTIKKPFTEEEVTSMRDACTSIRDLAIIDMLDSSMVRCSELIGLDISDIRWDAKECVVFGKGSKERVAYFDAKTSKHLKEYLETRKDNNTALFVSERAPHNRLTVSGIERMIHEVAKSAGVTNAHPHRFRRTGATRCLKAGVPLNAIQSMLRHSNISTTQIYASMDRSEVQHFYRAVYQ